MTEWTIETEVRLLALIADVEAAFGPGGEPAKHSSDIQAALDRIEKLDKEVELLTHMNKESTGNLHKLMEKMTNHD